MRDASFSGRDLRLVRLSRHSDRRHLFIPMDHSVSDGPMVDADSFNRLVERLVAGGADGVIVHQGRARYISPGLLRSCALIVHLSAGTSRAADQNAKVLVTGVEDALERGADAVSVHVNIGSDTEAQQLLDLGRVSSECRRWNVPLLAMMYARGPRIADGSDPALLAHVVNIAADLGADLVKTNTASPTERMADVVASCPIPILVAGGPDTGADLPGFARKAIRAGCGGLAVGRRVFSYPNPTDMVRQLARIVHGPEALIDSLPDLAGPDVRLPPIHADDIAV